MTTIDKILATRNARLGARTGDKNLACARADHSRFLGNSFHEFDALRAHLFHPHDHPAHIPNNRELKVARYLESLGWIIQTGPMVWRVTDEDGIRPYLQGMWLEELVFLAFEEVGADEVYFAQTIEWSVNGIEGCNEIDVIARRGGLISFTSCKAINIEKSKASMDKLREYLTETDYWNIHFANDAGRALLVTTADFYDEINDNRVRYPQLLARASILNVSLAGLEDLSWGRLVNAVEEHWGANHLNQRNFDTRINVR